jgi:hypothetical protein
VRFDAPGSNHNHVESIQSAPTTLPTSGRRVVKVHGIHSPVEDLDPGEVRVRAVVHETDEIRSLERVDGHAGVLRHAHVRAEIRIAAEARLLHHSCTMTQY